MLAVLGCMLALLALPFKSRSRLEADTAAVPVENLWRAARPRTGTASVRPTICTERGIGASDAIAPRPRRSSRSTRRWS